jgi:N-acetylated-alpha-linked acidic dipeptidase
MPRLLSSFILLSAFAYACQRDWDALHKRIHHNRSPLTKRADNSSYPPTLTDHENLLLNSFENTTLSTWSHYYTHGDHLGSHNKSMAEWTMQKWLDAGFDDAHLAEYPIYVTYPEHSSLKLIRPDGSTHEANLVEDVLSEDDTSGYPNLIPAYHAMSGSGNVTAEFVYVGYAILRLRKPGYVEALN